MRKALFILGISCIAIGSTLTGLAALKRVNKKPEVTHISVKDEGLYLELDNRNELFVDTETLEREGLIDTAHIVDWNSANGEMAVLTENDYEYYAYKKRNVY